MPWRRPRPTGSRRSTCSSSQSRLPGTGLDSYGAICRRPGVGSRLRGSADDRGFRISLHVLRCLVRGRKSWCPTWSGGDRRWGCNVGVHGLSSVRAKEDQRAELARAQEDRRVEFQLDLLRELRHAYRQVKAVRRTLRSYGFRRSEDDKWASAGKLTAAQSLGFHEQMALLVEAQLALEGVCLEVSQQPEIFNAPSAVEEQIRMAESYVNDVIGDWENYGVNIVEGGRHTDLVGVREPSGTPRTLQTAEGNQVKRQCPSGKRRKAGPRATPRRF